MKTNIKNLPEGRIYWTSFGYSQSYPWVQVRRTPKTAILKRVEVKSDPDWKPEFIPGGFMAHCTNQSEQTWLFDRIEEGYELVIRYRNGRWIGDGSKFQEDMARYFYDYNF